MAQKRFIFRWKESSLEVTLSRSFTPEQSWTWAEKNLYPAGMQPAEGAKFVRAHGEVVEVEP